MIKGVGMQKNIIETVKDAGTFTTLVAAIDRAGLEPTLALEGPSPSLPERRGVRTAARGNCRFAPG